MNNSVYKKRRTEVLKKIGPHGICIIFAAKEYIRTGKANYPYRQDSDFYYLSGFAEPQSILVLIPGRKEGEFVIFNQVKDPLMETWNGKRIGQIDACQKYGADQAFPISMADSMLLDLIRGRDEIFFNINIETMIEVRKFANLLKNKGRDGINPPFGFINMGKITYEMRMYKDQHEIGLIKQAAKITASAQKRAMRICKPGMFEYQISAEISHEFIWQGNCHQAFESIVACGPNTCILHYVDHEAIIKDGDLVLVDIGAEYKYYASDITRTFPANGKFNAEQKAIYQAVLDTQLEIIKNIKPGVPWINIQYLSEQLITQKLVDLKILHGDPKKLWEEKAFFPFYMHKFGHWLGLDAHDVETTYKKGSEWRTFEINKVSTVEPGIYISANHPDVDSKWWNIGVRIEDDVLVTENGCEVLSTDAPKTISEIEKLMAK